MKIAVEYQVSFYRYALRDFPNFRTQSSLVTPILLSLAAQDFEGIKEKLRFLDEHYEYERKSKHIASWLYRVLVGFILEKDVEKLPEYIESLKKGYSTKQHQKLYPYGLLLEAILKKDEKLFHENLQIVADKHKTMLRAIFDGYIDEFLCIWGIAFCNLAQMKGMKVEFDHPFIPKDLITL